MCKNKRVGNSVNLQTILRHCTVRGRTGGVASANARVRGLEGSVADHHLVWLTSDPLVTAIAVPISTQNVASFGHLKLLRWAIGVIIPLEGCAVGENTLSFVVLEGALQSVTVFGMGQNILRMRGHMFLAT